MEPLQPVQKSLNKRKGKGLRKKKVSFEVGYTEIYKELLDSISSFIADT